AAGGVLSLVYVLIVPLTQGMGAAWITTAPMAGLHYDAILHSLLLGFVFVMIFGHAPVIFPAVLHVKMTYYPRFYIHLILLEIAVIFRIVADLAGGFTGREWSGVLAVIAILIFLIQTASSV